MGDFQFGNVVVVDDDQVGVIVKSWADGSHDVYVRSYNGVRQYENKDIIHYIYSKELTAEEYEFYNQPKGGIVKTAYRLERGGFFNRRMIWTT